MPILVKSRVAKDMYLNTLFFVHNNEDFSDDMKRKKNNWTMIFKIYLSIYLSIYLILILSIYQFIYLILILSIYLSIYLILILSKSVHIYLSI